jgi:isopropylmalate/homocitrate/citramalate synthase
MPATFPADRPGAASTLRDGNQALIEPMGAAAQAPDVRSAREDGLQGNRGRLSLGLADRLRFRARADREGALIPDDVTIQVLTQARDELIERTFEALRACRERSCTSTTRPRPCSGGSCSAMDARHRRHRRARARAESRRWPPGIRARTSASNIRRRASPAPSSVRREICEAVMATSGSRRRQKKMILNLPATVEMSTPNVYADQIEWFGRNVKPRDASCSLVHPHNDRGTGVAAAELAVMAGADASRARCSATASAPATSTWSRWRSTCSRRASIRSSISRTSRDRATVEYCNQLPVHPRHPYGGDLVFTAFSGSHQDAIKKGFAAREDAAATKCGKCRICRSIPKISGALRSGHPHQQPVRQGRRRLRDAARLRLRSAARDADRIQQDRAILFGRERHGDGPSEIRDRSIANTSRNAPIQLIDYHVADDGNGRSTIEATIGERGGVRTIWGQGNGPIDSLDRRARTTCA